LAVPSGFRAFFIDVKDNVVYQDFVIRFSNHWEDIRLPIGGFRIYKGRKPLYGFEILKASLIPPKELEIIDIFEWRNIKIFGVQLQSVYDDQGRYNPAAAAVNESGNSVTWSTLAASTRTLKMDGFRFIKPLLVTSGQNTTRNLEPDFLQFPNITIYDQLINAAKSQLEIEKFKHKEFNIETSGDDMFDILFGDSFFLENNELVNDSDDGANTIKLVAKRIEYSITKPPAGRGGLRRRIQGSKKFTLWKMGKAKRFNTYDETVKSSRERSKGFGQARQSLSGIGSTFRSSPLPPIRTKIPIDASRWSEFPATQDVDMGGFTTTNQNFIDVENGICMGGFTTVAVTTTEEYNSGVWSAGGALGTAIRTHGGSGNNLDAISFGGPLAAPFTAVTEEYDSVVWTVGGALSTARGRLDGGGNSSSAISIGGDTGSVSAVTEEYNGVSWSTGGSLATARRGPGGDGIL